MFCKNCGAELAEGSKFCASCGTAAEIPAQPIAEPVEEGMQTPAEPIETPAADAASAPEAPKADPLKAIKEKAAPLLEKVKPFLQKNKLLLAGAGAIVLFIIAIAIIIGLCSGGNGFIAYENAIIANVQEDEVIVLWNNKVIKTGIEASVLEEQATNLDGTVFAGLTDEGTLFVVRNKKVHVVEEDVVSFTLSASGKALAYVCENDDDEYSLNLYTISKKKSVVVDNEYNVLVGAFLGTALSPDGKNLAYYRYDDEEDISELMLFTGKKSIKITSNETELIGLSNGGKYIYVKGENDDGDENLYTYNKKGERTKINACSGSTFYFNDDHTQILFNNDGKSYISVKGKEASKISSGTARLLLSSNSSSCSDGRSTTYPVEDLYKHVYTVYNDGEYNLWNIKKNSDKSAKLASDITSATLDAEAEYVYYVNDKDDLCVLKISHGDKASDKAKTIAEDVDTYVVTSDRKKVYFISDDGLYSCNGKNGKSKKTIASEDVTAHLAINAKDVVYYQLDGDLYACSNGKKGSKVLSDSNGFLAYPNGVVYAADEDWMYITTGAKKLKKLLDLEN